MSETDHHRNSHSEWIKEFPPHVASVAKGAEHSNSLPPMKGTSTQRCAPQALKPEFRCQFCQGTFTYLNSLNGHKRICKKNPQTEQ
ncbi:hypothetical protein N7465_007665 [Penicillium sp. CMV-2018d]|nr:hypothetical protein N7465_007665 [Penicillium sp. CMV-2018d]